jgi:hypothetical protein
VTALTSETLANLYSGAADRIQEFGWWAGDLDNRGANYGPGRECLWTAIIAAAHVLGIRLDREMTLDAATPIFEHFGISDRDDDPDSGFMKLFELNDTQPAQTGPQWAISNLRELARKVA